jgi:hypothetical protein
VSITTSTEPRTGARLHRVEGELQLDVLQRALEAVYQSEHFDPDGDVLWDVREADLSSFSSSDVRQVADFVEQHWGGSGSSRAALVVSGDLDFGLARMYEQLLESRRSGEVRVFRDLDDAVDWLSR